MAVHPCTLNMCVPVVQWPRTPPFHGGNTGSNPVGDANKTKKLAARLGGHCFCGKTNVALSEFHSKCTCSNSPGIAAPVKSSTVNMNCEGAGCVAHNGSGAQKAVRKRCRREAFVNEDVSYGLYVCCFPFWFRIFIKGSRPLARICTYAEPLPRTWPAPSSVVTSFTLGAP